MNLPAYASEVLKLKVDVDDAEPNPVIANRLSLIISPTTTKQQKTKNSRKTSRNIIILKDFGALPLDVILEIVSLIEPVDLLNLARVSKSFRGLLMSRAAVSLWRRVLSQFEDLPSCPEDLTEPQYASLMFEAYCMACLGCRGTIHADFKLRLRLCTSCTKKNLVTGHTLKSRLKLTTFASRFLTFIPSTGPDRPLPVLISLENTLKMKYFLPEAELVLAEHDKSRTQEEQVGFWYDRQAIATKMMNEGVDIQTWAASYESRKRQAIEEIRSRRRKRITAEMESLGWEKKYFPNYFSCNEDAKKWREYLRLNQEKEFSIRGWNMIRPRMEAIYERQKNSIQRNELLQKIEARYDRFRQAKPDPARIQMPPFHLLDDLPCVIDFMDSHAGTGTASEESFQVLMQKLEDGKGDWFFRTKEALFDLVQASFPDEKLDIRIMDMAKMVFFCECDSCDADEEAGKRLFGFPEILDHLVSDSVFPSFNHTDASIDVRAMRAAEDVLVALGYSRDASLVEVGSPKPVCYCTQQGYQPKKFTELVDHVYSERLYYDGILNNVLPHIPNATIDELLINKHDASRLQALLKGPNEENATPLSIIAESDDRLCCRYCYRLVYRANYIPAGAQAYHMETKHGRTLTDGDLVSRDELVTTYGTQLAALRSHDNSLSSK